jgi:hypothetical protein
MSDGLKAISRPTVGPLPRDSALTSFAARDYCGVPVHVNSHIVDHHRGTLEIVVPSVVPSILWRAGATVMKANGKSWFLEGRIRDHSESLDQSLPPYGDCSMMRLTVHVLACWFALSIGRPAPAVSEAISAQQPSQETFLWDTQIPFVEEVGLGDRAHWKVVRGSRSDSAAYAFGGDAVVENQHVTAVFCSKRGRVSIYPKANPSQKKVEFVPLELKGKSAQITRCTILRNTGDATVLEISFSGGETEDDLSAVFSFGNKESVAIEPAGSMRGISLLSPMEYGIVPSLIGDDLIFKAGKYPSMDTLHVPCDTFFLGLLKGRDEMLVVTWPEGKQKARLVLDKGAGDRLVESFDCDNDGKSVYLALLHAPGIWHKEELKPSFLERDVAIGWKRPFPAKWRTQLLEAGVRTTFTFRESKKDIWRAVLGYYTYPVWFEGQTAHFHLGKKIPPTGESLIYYLERRNVSDASASVVDILRQTLEKETCERKLSVRGRASLDLVRPDSHLGSDDLAQHAARGSCPVSTCAVTQRLESIFQTGQEQERWESVEAGTQDMLYFLGQHRKRIDEYMAFAHDMTEFLEQEGKSKPTLGPFTREMQRIVRQIPQEYDRLKEVIKDLQYAAELGRQTAALARKKSPRNLEAFSDLGRKWRTMGGAQDDLVRVFHTLTRQLFQEAGYGCAGLPDAVATAEEIRRRCRKCLSNPSTYEIWPDY